MIFNVLAIARNSSRDGVFLASKGITVGRRGRFSAAAKQALSEAEKQGIKFTGETKTAKN